MQNNKNIFLTGITGFLGSFLAKELFAKGYNIFALARGKKDKSARDRVYDALKFVYEDEWNERDISQRLKVIEGDITCPDLGIRREEVSTLESETDIIIHSAALAELRMPLDVIREVNVEGTWHVLDFALRCQEKGRLKKFNHISTMYVAGDYEGDFNETMLDVGQGFHNTYEQTKFEAEKLVWRHRHEGINVSTFRPSLIMGDSATGKTNNFRLFYQPVHYFSKELFMKYPADFNCSQNLINIDTVALAISSLIEEKEAVYHIISPDNTTVGSLINLAADYFGFKTPEFIPLEKFDYDELTPTQMALCEEHAPYFNYRARFLASETKQILEKYNFKFPEIDRANLQNIFNYCVQSGFIGK